MRMFDWILILLGASIVLPILAFLVMKLGTFGLYSGKEAFRKQNKFNSVQNNDNDNNEIEN